MSLSSLEIVASLEGLPFHSMFCRGDGKRLDEDSISLAFASLSFMKGLPGI
jgi:hypothetical protein